MWRIFSTSFDEGKTFRPPAIDDRNRSCIALTYDDGKLVEVKDSAGRTIKLTSTKQGRLASVEVKGAEHQGRWIAFARYRYDDRGRLLRVTDADDCAWTYEYDELDRLVRDTDRCGLRLQGQYEGEETGLAYNRPATTRPICDGSSARTPSAWMGGSTSSLTPPTRSAGPIRTGCPPTTRSSSAAS